MTHFELWAPSAAKVRVHLGGDDFPLSPSENGWWRSDIEAKPQVRYKFSALIDGDWVGPFPDPCAARMPDGVHGDSEVWYPPEQPEHQGQAQQHEQNKSGKSPEQEQEQGRFQQQQQVQSEKSQEQPQQQDQEQSLQASAKEGNQEQSLSASTVTPATLANLATAATTEATTAATEATAAPAAPAATATASASVSATPTTTPSSPWRGRRLEGSVIYELHVGTFTPEGTFESAARKLDYLKSVGVTMVELMPVAPFGGTRNWGYDGVNWFGVQESYGGPDGLLDFVEKCHEAGLAVCLDVVYNHFGPDGAYGGAFAPYTAGGSTGWGEVVNLVGDHSDEVRKLILASVRRWFEVFGIDALRLDAVHALDDPGAYPILEQMQDVAADVERVSGVPRSLIAESDQNDPRIIGDFGLAGQWCDDVHHAIHAAVSGEHHAYYGDFGSPLVLATALERGFWHDGRFSSFRGRTHGRPLDRLRLSASSLVTYTTTHDQTGNRAAGDRPSQNLSPAQQVVKAAIVLTSPFTPMLFQGEEWGASTPFPFFCSHESDELNEATRQGRRREFARAGWDEGSVPDPAAVETFDSAVLRWDEVDSGVHGEILSAYRVLLRLRAESGSLGCGSFDSISADWRDDLGNPAAKPHGVGVKWAGLLSCPPVVSECSGGSGRWLRVVRSCFGCSRFVVLVNLSDDAAEVPLPFGSWRSRFSFSASGRSDDGDVLSSSVRLGSWQTLILEEVAS